MLITHQEKLTDPLYPIMQGATPIAVEFNKRMKALWESGNIPEIKFETITTIFLEIFGDEYNKRHAKRKKVSKK